MPDTNEQVVSKLPPLPEFDKYRWNESVVIRLDLLHKVMLEYGQQCAELALASQKFAEQVQHYNAAIEASADLIKNGSFLHDQSPAKLFADEVVPKILELKLK